MKPEGVFFQIQEQSKDCRFIFVGFSKKLIEECQVITTPGSAFGTAGEGYIRISFASSQETLEEAMRRIQSVFGMK